MTAPISTNRRNHVLLLKKPNLSTRVGLAVLVAAIGVLLFAGGAAFATSGNHVVPQGTCTEAEAHAGSTGVAHNGDLYRCEQRTAEDRATHCGHWHHIPNPGPHPSWSKRPPAPCPCSASPSPSKSAGTSASASASPSASQSPSTSGSASAAGSPTPSGSVKTTPVAATLPITGTPSVVLGIAATGVFLVAGGAVLLLTLARRRRI